MQTDDQRFVARILSSRTSPKRVLRDVQDDCSARHLNQESRKENRREHRAGTVHQAVGNHRVAPSGSRLKGGNREAYRAHPRSFHGLRQRQLLQHRRQFDRLVGLREVRLGRRQLQDWTLRSIHAHQPDDGERADQGTARHRTGRRPLPVHRQRQGRQHRQVLWLGTAHSIVRRGIYGDDPRSLRQGGMEQRRFSRQRSHASARFSDCGTGTAVVLREFTASHFSKAVHLNMRHYTLVFILITLAIITVAIPSVMLYTLLLGIGLTVGFFLGLMLGKV